MARNRKLKQEVEPIILQCFSCPSAVFCSSVGRSMQDNKPAIMLVCANCHKELCTLELVLSSYNLVLKAEKENIMIALEEGEVDTDFS